MPIARPAGLGQTEETGTLATPWTDRIWQEFHAGNLTRAWRDVLLTLQGYEGCGFIWPSHAALAARAGCCVRTVQRALAAAHSLGLVAWFERRIKEAWRSLRTSNRYSLISPEAPVATTGLKDRGMQRKQSYTGASAVQAATKAALNKVTRALPGAHDIPEAVQAALAKVRQAMETAMVTRQQRRAAERDAVKAQRQTQSGHTQARAWEERRQEHLRALHSGLRPIY